MPQTRQRKIAKLLPSFRPVCLISFGRNKNAVSVRQIDRARFHRRQQSSRVVADSGRDLLEIWNAWRSKSDAATWEDVCGGRGRRRRLAAAVEEQTLPARLRMNFTKQDFLTEPRLSYFESGGFFGAVCGKILASGSLFFGGSTEMIWM